MPKKKSVSYHTVGDALQLDRAYDWFNKHLFGSKLPSCLVTLQRKKGAYGYFSPRRFESKFGSGVRDEIALNPDEFSRSDKEVLSTLVHEMVHLWQECFGAPGRGRYHNLEWANKMLEIGLRPIANGNEQKMTGDKVTHRIVDGGLFDTCYGKLRSQGFVLRWVSKPVLSISAQSVRSKVKYSCLCSNIWGKPGLSVGCIICGCNFLEVS